MKHPFQNLKHWYRGKHIPYTLQEMMDLQQPRYGIRQKQNLPDRYDPPKFARFINSIVRFYFRHWKFIIGTIIAVIGIVVKMFIAG